MYSVKAKLSLQTYGWWKVPDFTASSSPPAFLQGNKLNEGVKGWAWAAVQQLHRKPACLDSSPPGFQPLLEHTAQVLGPLLPRWQGWEEPDTALAVAWLLPGCCRLLQTDTADHLSSSHSFMEINKTALSYWLTLTIVGIGSESVARNLVSQVDDRNLIT